MNNLLKRSLSGIVYVGLIIGAILLGGPYFMGLTTLFAILAIFEFSRMVSPSNSLLSYSVDAFCTIMIVLSASIFLPFSGSWGFFFLYSACISLIVRFVMTIFDNSGHALSNLAYSVLGIVYIGIPLGLLNCVYSLNHDLKWLVFCAFIFIWLNDTGAFCVGSLIGKRRLCERLSPKKSWEGFWGGFVCCVGFAIGAHYIFNMYSVLAWIILGALVSVFATWGDLFESLIKRTVNVKDSGNLIPGHGGILDRIDSLLFVSPVLFLFAIFMFMI